MTHNLVLYIHKWHLVVHHKHTALQSATYIKENSFVASNIHHGKKSLVSTIYEAQTAIQSSPYINDAQLYRPYINDAQL